MTAEAPQRSVVGEFNCGIGDDGYEVRMVRLDCGHADPKVHEDGTDPGDPRPCWACWRERRDEVLAERRARRRSS